ncbi:hypothetical protein ACJJTC_013061 [Scirpophaga incertulas]
MRSWRKQADDGWTCDKGNCMWPNTAGISLYCWTPGGYDGVSRLDLNPNIEFYNTQLLNDVTICFQSKELSSECGMGLRAPDTLPGLKHHYPHCGDRSSSKCDIMGVTKLVNEVSPSSSSESSPTEVSSYRRLGERPPLMRRLALGLSGAGAGALLQPSDDDSTPLVADTPTTPTNLPLLCTNGGYVNEASEAELRTRESNREPPPRRRDDSHRNCNSLKNGCGSGASSSSGASGSGSGSRSMGSGSGSGSGSGNNNLPRAEPELRHAPWFQHGIPREIALEVLRGQPEGAFLVRGSGTQAGCYALSVRVPRGFAAGGIAHYLILRSASGYKIKVRVPLAAAAARRPAATRSPCACRGASRPAASRTTSSCARPAATRSRCASHSPQQRHAGRLLRALRARAAGLRGRRHRALPHPALGQRLQDQGARPTRRSSGTQAGCYALSVRVPRGFAAGGIAHYLILRSAGGYNAFSLASCPVYYNVV